MKMGKRIPRKYEISAMRGHASDLSIQADLRIGRDNDATVDMFKQLATYWRFAARELLPIAEHALK
jgi:hypothetical protein